MAVNRTAGLLAAPILLASLIGAGPASAATWDNLCGGVAAARGDNFPADEDLLRAARLSEQRLAAFAGSTDPLDEVFGLLELPASTATLPAAEALARYCSAAGEAMRRSPEGSQYQAQLFLIRAYRSAADAGLDPVTSRAAYRFGLVSVASPIGAGVRGNRGGRRRGGSEMVVEDARQAQQDADNPCSALSAADLQTTSNTYLSAVALECAAAAAQRAGDPALSATASLRLARQGLTWSESAAEGADDLRRDALDTIVAAVPVAIRVTDPVLREELLGRLIGTAIDLGGGEHAGLLPAVDVLRGNGTEAYATSLPYAVQARLALLRGDRDGARSLIRQALLVESQKALPARVPEYYLMMAQADPEDRRRHVFAAYTALENMRPLLPRLDPLTEETSFALYMRRVFEAAADVQLAGAAAGAEGDAIEAAQQIIEAYRQAELQSAVGSECLPPREPLRPQDLRPGEIVLYPLLLPDRIELLYVSGSEAAGGEVRFRRLPPNRNANRQQVTALVEAMVLSLTYQQDDQWRGPARMLYQLLVAPIEDRLEPGAMLAIIPDGPLRALPFATLLAADGQYLIQKTRIGVAPALAYLQPGSPQRDGALNIVAASLQRRMNLSAGLFAALEGTAAEAQAAADSGDPGIHLADFRKADLVAALGRGNVDILHLATHASFNGRADRAFIVANEEVIRLPELREIIERNRTRGDSLDLLILSACETAVGDDQASMGLAGATVQAGAQSAIASLWQVDDIGTTALMRQFYANYRSGRSRSEALREAQLALIDGGGDDADPRIWSAFQLIGAWR